MKNKGFTLIELLAVIVILAIIALIATPIILGIINDTKEESNERSVELYATALRNGLAQYQLKNDETVLPGIYTSSALPFEVSYDGNVECSAIEIYEDGTIYVEGCIVNQGKKEYSDGIKQEKTCTLESDADNSGTITIGDVYKCKVKENMEEGYEDGYTFYVLSNNTDESGNILSTNLILEKGITYDSENDIGYIGNSGVAWDVGSSAATGPVTAMTYLHNATKDWNNIPNIEINHKNYNLNGKKGYYEITTEEGVTRIIHSDKTTVTAEFENLKSRLLFYNELTEEATFLYINGLHWTIDSYGGNTNNACFVNGTNGLHMIWPSYNYNIRPVITIELS